MKIAGRPHTTIWPTPAGVEIIDQTRLPHRFETVEIADLEAAARAISHMQVRGAPLIGVMAAYGLAFGLSADPSDAGFAAAKTRLRATRPTAVNLRWALERVGARVAPLPARERFAAARAEAALIAQEDVALCEAIGEHGLALVREAATRKGGGRVNVLTHCNAGWLATVDWGTATAPIYKAHDAGIDVHVYVDETRPRNQGASLTAFELGEHGVPHTLVVDNAGGHLMQHGEIDLVLVGTDRTTASGDVCNKIGTYLKALAAFDNDVPFYVCAPSPSIDFSMSDGIAQIPIELRAEEEVTHICGLGDDGEIARVRLSPKGTKALNPAFDVTPARLVTGLVTERGVIAANARAIAATFRR
ncbi:S-methyl-5-thioribose-1-phosphate isomerase [Methylocella sp.]|uniref:S-methyl-5-thioribose-1-phosphate isomerase n=1 Tax=Methylocella sp. TaxID=1978226 RepID=UPI0037852F18